MHFGALPGRIPVCSNPLVTRVGKQLGGFDEFAHSMFADVLVLNNPPVEILGSEHQERCQPNPEQYLLESTHLKLRKLGTLESQIEPTTGVEGWFVTFPLEFAEPELTDGNKNTLPPST
jgi:hypothetical protein